VCWILIEKIIFNINLNIDRKRDGKEEMFERKGMTKEKKIEEK
jgi:hypothetical protein